MLKEEYEKLLKGMDLKSKETAQPRSDEEYVELVKICNQKIDDVKDEELVKKGYNGIYSYYVSALATKLVLFSGIKNNVILNLKLDCYNENLNKILINGFEVHLPDDLARQMRRYITIREKILEPGEETVLLFINLNRENRKLDNAKMFKILKDVIGTNKAVSVAKYSILQMIACGIPENIIRQFTNYSDEVYGHRQEMMDEVQGGKSFMEYNRRLDAGLRMIGIFDEDRIQ